MMNASSWAITQLVVKIGHRFSGEEIRVLTKDVERISYEESTIYSIRTKNVDGPQPASDLAPVDAKT